MVPKLQSVSPDPGSYVIKILFHYNGEMKAVPVIKKKYFMPNGLTYIILHNEIPPNFQGSWGEDIK